MAFDPHTSHTQATDGALPDAGGLEGGYWRLLAYSLLHGGQVHFLLNVSLLSWTGRIVERRVGGWRMAGMYVVAVLAGGLLISWWKSLHPTPGVSLDASSGVFCLLAVSLVLLHRRDAAAFGQNPRIRGILWLILGAGIIGSLLPGVSLVGHLGGLAVGGMSGFWTSIRPVHENPDH